MSYVLCVDDHEDMRLMLREVLVSAGHEVAAVYCQPPRPAGRGKALQPGLGDVVQADHLTPLAPIDSHGSVRASSPE